MVILITGGSSGIGLETAKLLASKNHIIYCLSRNPLKDFSSINFLKCDVCDENMIKKCVDYILSKHENIDVLINNAGIGISGPIELESFENIDKIIDINLKGYVNMTKIMLPSIRKSKGKIINIGSIAGELAIPFQSMYSLTKAGISSFSESLANEVYPFKVRVCCILPGDTKTSFTSNRIKNNEESVYLHRVNKSLLKMESDEKNGDSPLKVAKVINKVINKKNPPLFVAVGFKYKVFLFLKKILPRRLVNYILYMLYAK